MKNYYDIITKKEKKPKNIPFFIFYTHYASYLFIQFQALTDNKCTTNNKTTTGLCEPIIINWMERPPYIFLTEDNNNKISGILPKVMEAIVKHCCGPCQEIKYNIQAQEESQLIALYGISFVILMKTNFPSYVYLYFL